MPGTIAHPFEFPEKSAILIVQGTMPLPRTIRRIVLTGFMGAGKSTVGPMLAQHLGWEFLDADTAIEARAGKTIVEIFAQQIDNRQICRRLAMRNRIRFEHQAADF